MCQTRETRGEPDTQRARLPPPPAPRSRHERGGQTNATKQVHKRGRGRAEGQTQRCSTSGQEGVGGQVWKSLPEQVTAEWKRVTERASRGVDRCACQPCRSAASGVPTLRLQADTDHPNTLSRRPRPLGTLSRQP